MKKILFLTFAMAIAHTGLSQWNESSDGEKITTPAKVGIITSNPDANLTIGGGALTTYNLKIKDQVGRSIEIISPTIGSAFGRMKITGTNSSLRLGVRDYPDVFHISGIGGKVGFGTVNPYSFLDVVSSKDGADHLMTIRNNTATNYSSAGIALINSTSNGSIAGARLFSTRRTGSGTVDFNVQIYDGNLMKQRLTVLGTNGKVGIGTTSPDANLTIGGEALVTYNLKIKDQVGRAIELISPTQSSPVGKLKITDTNSSLQLGVRDFPETIHIKGADGFVGIGTNDPQSKLARI